MDNRYIQITIIHIIIIIVIKRQAHVQVSISDAPASPGADAPEADGGARRQQYY